MARATNPNTVHDYILTIDRDLPIDDPERTVFKLKPLTAGQFAQVQDARGMTMKLAEEDKVEFKEQEGTAILTRVRLGLVGWVNFKDEANQDIPWANGKNLNYLTPSMMMELSRAIIDLSAPNPEQRKNLSSGHSLLPENLNPLTAENAAINSKNSEGAPGESK